MAIGVGNARGGNQRGTLNLTHVGEQTIRLKHAGGGIVNEKPFMAALAVINNGARIVGDNGRPVSPTMIVVCRKAFGLGNPLRQSRIGIPIQAIDPGGNHDLYVLPGSTTFAPTIPKAQCHRIGECTIFTGECAGCHNFPKDKRK